MDYDPLLTPLILSRLFHYLEDIELIGFRIVHPIWNEVLSEFPLFVHPWIKTQKVLRSLVKNQQLIAIKPTDEIFCDIYGCFLKIHQQENNKYYFALCDHEQKYSYKFHHELPNDLQLKYFTSGCEKSCSNRIIIHKDYCQDNKRHLLFYVTMIGRFNIIIDYTDLRDLKTYLVAVEPRLYQRRPFTLHWILFQTLGGVIKIDNLSFLHHDILHKPHADLMIVEGRGANFETFSNTGKIVFELFDQDVECLKMICEFNGNQKTIRQEVSILTQDLHQHKEYIWRQTFKDNASQVSLINTTLNTVEFTFEISKYLELRFQPLNQRYLIIISNYSKPNSPFEADYTFASIFDMETKKYLDVRGYHLLRFLRGIRQISDESFLAFFFKKGKYLKCWIKIIDDVVKLYLEE